MMTCTKCKRPIQPKTPYHRTKKGPHHRDCMASLAAPSGSAIRDTFQGDNKLLRECIKALIELNDSNSLVPHGIGGHARNLLSACYHRLPNAPGESDRRPMAFGLAQRLNGGSLDPVVRALVDALDEVTRCPACNGTKTWTPECCACLCGEPDRCTCIIQQPETCPQCNGTGRDFAGSEQAEKMIALYCPNDKMSDGPSNNPNT